VTPAPAAPAAPAAPQASRPQVQRWLDDVGAAWSKGVIVATLGSLLLLALSGVPLLGPRGAVYRALGVLTAGSPCALVLVPLAYVCALAAITKRGILVKSAGALDALASCQAVALDKTGTITTGSLTLTGGYVLGLDPASGARLSSAPILGLPNSRPNSPAPSRPGSPDLGALPSASERPLHPPACLHPPWHPAGTQARCARLAAIKRSPLLLPLPPPLLQSARAPASRRALCSTRWRSAPCPTTR
jgi:Cd2+/Zn2+-exporting ATPase